MLIDMMLPKSFLNLEEQYVGMARQVIREFLKVNFGY